MLMCLALLVHVSAAAVGIGWRESTPKQQQRRQEGRSAVASSDEEDGDGEALCFPLRLSPLPPGFVRAGDDDVQPPALQVAPFALQPARAQVRRVPPPPLQPHPGDWWN